MIRTRFNVSRLVAMAAVAVICLSSYGCRRDRPGKPLDPDERQARADAFMTELEHEFTGRYTFKWVKFGQEDGNFAVIEYTDLSTGAKRVMAADLAEYTAGTNYFEYAASRRFYFRLTSNGDGTYSCKQSSCIGYDRTPRSSSLLFEATEGTPRDLEKAAAFLEEFKIANMSEHLAASFGLSEERSVRMAKLISQWDRISKSRAMTAQDADVIAKEALGTSFREFDEAYVESIQGSSARYNAMIKRAADLNEISPEQFNAILGRLFQ